jgi:hypothetical protein
MRGADGAEFRAQQLAAVCLLDEVERRARIQRASDRDRFRALGPVAQRLQCRFEKGAGAHFDPRQRRLRLQRRRRRGGLARAAAGGGAVGVDEVGELVGVGRDRERRE